MWIEWERFVLAIKELDWIQHPIGHAVIYCMYRKEEEERRNVNNMINILAPIAIKGQQRMRGIGERKCGCL